MLQLKTKQAEAVQAVNDPQVDTLVLFGTVGTGKTDVAAHIVLSIADQFPKVYSPVFRQNISTAIKTVIPSYLEMAEQMNLVAGVDYKYNRSAHVIEFPNGSVIPFIEADVTKDREGKKIKGINATCNQVDEADELAEEMFIQATSRRGRRNKQGAPSISIITMNPNDGWAKRRFYDPWKAGTLTPNIRCIEFDISDSWQSQRDIAAMKTNPTWWTERYLFNNWDYADESLSLFKSRHWDASLVRELDSTATRSAGYDVARKAQGDRSVRGLAYGLVIADLAIAKDTHEDIGLPEQSKWLMADALKNRYGLDRTAIDAVGLGIGLIDDLHREGFNPHAFMSGAKPDPDVRLDAGDYSDLNFDNLRSQMIYLYARGIELELIKHYASLPFLHDLFKEAAQHHYGSTDKVFRVESKDHVRKRLGKSPDLFDAVLMTLYVALKQVPTMDSYDEYLDDDAITEGLLDETF